MYEDLDYEALNEFILVKQVIEDKSTRGGIIIPENAQGSQNKGIVISKGHLVECQVEVGQLFCFSEYACQPIELNGEDFILVRGTDAFLKQKSKPNVRVGKNRKIEVPSLVSA
jgi:co-chaperonin GroES (HSP10)